PGAFGPVGPEPGSDRPGGAGGWQRRGVPGHRAAQQPRRGGVLPERRDPADRAPQAPGLRQGLTARRRSTTCDKTAPGGRSFSCRAAGMFPGDRCLPWRYAPLEAECMLWRKGGLALKALIVWGGWDGHQPDLVAEIFRREIVAMGGEAEVYHTLDVFVEKDLLAYDLIIPIWTMGEITPPQVKAVTEAVAAGVGLAGCHGGMCDAFRTCVEWQFMTGGQWVAHPGNDGVEYTVNIVKGSHPIVEGLEDFKVKSEQYYMHVDPAVKVLATTRFPVEIGRAHV